jgi:N-acetylmuramoyl-L-alanine amidase
MLTKGIAAAALAMASWGAMAQAPWTVAVDAGHTARAQGARAAGDGRWELAFNQDLAADIAAELARGGDRPRMANSPPMAKESFKKRVSAGKGADFFLSVHHDSAAESQLAKVEGRWEDHRDRFKGFSLFVDPADARGVACASSIGRALIKAGERPSLYHADPAVGTERPFVDKAAGVHACPGLAVARMRAAPMALLEAGVIVNPSESRRLRRPEVRAAIAKAVAQGLRGCR